MAGSERTTQRKRNEATHRLAKSGDSNWHEGSGARRRRKARRDAESASFLEAAHLSRLLVDVAETLPLLAILEQAGGGHDERGVDTNHAEDAREDVVDEDVGERGDGGRAALHQGGGSRARAGRVRHEGGRRAVDVAAAVKLSQLSAPTLRVEQTPNCPSNTHPRLHQVLDRRRLRSPQACEVLLRLKSQDPQNKTDNQAKDAAQENHNRAEFEPAARGRDDGRDREQERNEDQDGVGDARYRRR